MWRTRWHFKEVKEAAPWLKCKKTNKKNQAIKNQMVLKIQLEAWWTKLKCWLKVAIQTQCQWKINPLIVILTTFAITVSNWRISFCSFHANILRKMVCKFQINRSLAPLVNWIMSPIHTSPSATKWTTSKFTMLIFRTNHRSEEW